MRQVRILALCLVATFAVSVAAVAPAMAKKYTAETWEQYKHCPLENPKVQECIAGITSGGKSGGFFQLGKVEVPLTKPIVLQGGIEEPNGEPGLPFVGAAPGGETVESPELPVRNGIKLITKEVQEQDHWPEALKQSFKEALANKETGLDVKIEVAGHSYEGNHTLSVENLIEEEGPAFILPLKVKLTGPWLAKLGGGTCTVGNEEHPIIQELTSADGGTSGHVLFNKAFTAVEVDGSRLVDFGWPVESGSYATGCGGEYEQYVNEAIDQVSVEAASYNKGFTVLQGTLFNGIAEVVRKKAEEGKV